MSDEIVFYTNPMSRGRIARWMLEEVGKPYRTEILQFDTSIKDPRYKAINPMGKVPAIEHNGNVVTEAAAICAYLADAFPEAKLAPPTDSRADYYRWMFFVAGPMEAAVSNKMFGFEVPADRERSIGYGNFKSVMDTLEYALTRHPYVAGDSFTAADVYVGSHLNWGFYINSIEKRDAFLAYFERMTQRPAFQRASQIDDELAQKMMGG